MPRLTTSLLLALIYLSVAIAALTTKELADKLSGERGEPSALSADLLESARRALGLPASHVVPKEDPAQTQAPTRNAGVYVIGDPMICSGTQGCHYYIGPATVVCLDDESGALSSIDFVGVSDYDGQCKMCSDADYVDDVWSWDARTGKWAFTRGVPHSFRGVVTCRSSAEKKSDAAADAKPTSAWLDEFKESDLTFTVTKRGYTVGPKFDLIVAALSNPELISELVPEGGLEALAFTPQELGTTRGRDSANYAFLAGLSSLSKGVVTCHHDDAHNALAGLSSLVHGIRSLCLSMIAGSSI